MAKAKNDTSKQSDDSALEKRVDAMMDPRAEDDTQAADNLTAKPLPPLDIYAEPTSAPPLTTDEKSNESQAESAPETVAIVAEAPTESIQEDIPSSDVEVKPLNIDTPQSDAAIDDIVAQEADVVLAAEDANTEAQNDDVVVDETPVKRGHPIFWFIIFMLALLCVIAGFMLVNPNVSLPFSA